MREGRREPWWIAAALPLVLAGGLAAVALATTPARYTPEDLVPLAATYLSLAGMLHFGTAALLRRGRLLGALGALAVGGVLAGHLREQGHVLGPHGRLAAAAALTGLAYYALARSSGAGHWPRRPVAACLASAAALALVTGVSFFSSPSFRWHLLRHNKLVGTLAYYALAEPVDTLCDSMWSARSGPDSAFEPADPAEPLAPAGPPPNLVVVMIDTLRADALAAYGAPSPRMPRVDALAERGAVFTDVLANSSWTRPSVASLFTGLRPEEHGANAGDRLPEARRTLAEMLRDAGYETAAVVSNFAVVGAQSGFAQGFERFEELQGDPWPYARADRVTDAALGFVDGRAARGAESKPLFLYLHYLDPHDPYLSGITPGRWPDMYRDAYANELRFLDPQLERLISAIGERLAGPTFVLLTADHGEEFGEHGEGGHGHSLYSELVRVPAMLLGPGVEGQRIDARLEGRDFHDLLARLARGGPPDPAAWARSRQRERRLTSVYSSTKAGWHHPRMRRVCMRGIEEDGYFLIWSSFGPNLQLYRREDDPGETLNRVGTEPERTAAMKQALDAEPRVWATPVPVELRDETAELLRRLGYAE